MPIHFNDELDVTEFTQHSRSLLDDLFWEDDEIAEFRHQAFLIECGLATEEDDDDDREEEEDDIVSLEGFELSEGKKDVVTQMHSSLPVIQFDFDILESKQSCLNKGPANKLPESPKSSSSQSGSNKRISKFQQLVDRQRKQANKASPSNSPSISPVGRPSKKLVLRPSPLPTAEPMMREAPEHEDESDQNSRRDISIQDRLLLWKKRDETSHLTNIDAIPPSPSKFIETSSPSSRKHKIVEKRLRRSTRKSRLPPLSLENSNASLMDTSDRSLLDSSETTGLDTTQESPLGGSPTPTLHQMQSESSETPAPVKSPKPNRKSAVTINSQDTPRASKKKSVQIHETSTKDELAPSISVPPKSPKTIPSKGKANIKNPLSSSSVDSFATPMVHAPKSPKTRCSKERVTSEERIDGCVSFLDITQTSPKTSSANAATNAKEQWLSMNSSSNSLENAEKSPRTRSSKVKTRKKNLSLSSTETTASSNYSMDDTSKSSKNISPKVKKSEDPGTPRSSRKKVIDKAPSLLEVDCPQTVNEHSKSPKTRSTKSNSTCEKPPSLSSLETSSSHSLTEPPKSPKTRTGKKSDEPATPRSSKRKSLSLRKSDVPNELGSSRPSKSKSLSLKGSEISAKACSVAETALDLKTPKSAKNNLTEAIIRDDTEKNQSSVSKPKRNSDPTGHTMTITIKKKSRKKQDASQLRRQLVNRSLSMSLVVEQNDIKSKESRCPIMKRSNSVNIST